MTRKKLHAVLLTFLVGCSSPTEISVIAHDNAGPDLKESIGIETLGGVFTPLLKAGCRLPCEVTQVFSTAEDNQDQIMISLLRGTSAMASGAEKIGVFSLSGISPAPRGAPQIAVSFVADTKQVLLRAVDNRNKDHLMWARIN